jgi:type I restriction enzyme, S subunit
MTTVVKPSPLVPKFRFPEFSERGPWVAKPLDNLCNRLSETVGDAKLVPVSISAGKGFLPQAEKFGRDISGTQYNRYIWLRRGDFAYNRGNSKRFPQGCVYKLTEFEDAAASNAFYCFRLHDGLEPAFVLGFFEDNGHGRQLTRHVTSGARSNGLLNISADTFFGISIPVPPTATEQQKIADCLRLLDQLIAAERRKLEALRQHKQGLMQQFFPQPGETVPRLRFPEFQNAGEWAELALGSCFSHIRNGFVGTATPSYVNDGVPYLQGKNVKNGRIDSTGLVTISEAFHEKQRKSQLRADDIIMVQSGHVGECAVVGSAYAGANCHALIIMTPKDGQHSPFFAHCFGSDYGRRLLAQITTGNTIKHILATEVNALTVHSPSLPEQQRIAAGLSSLDEVLAAQSRKVDGLTSHKQGLLQQLFPSMEGNES